MIAEKILIVQPLSPLTLSMIDNHRYDNREAVRKPVPAFFLKPNIPYFHHVSEDVKGGQGILIALVFEEKVNISDIK